MSSPAPAPAVLNKPLGLPLRDGGADTTEMTLHISAHHQFRGVGCSSALSPAALVTYNYSPLHGDSATDSKLEGHS